MEKERAYLNRPLDRLEATLDRSHIVSQFPPVGPLTNQDQLHLVRRQLRVALRDRHRRYYKIPYSGRRVQSQSLFPDRFLDRLPLSSPAPAPAITAPSRTLSPCHITRNTTACCPAPARDDRLISAALVETGRFHYWVDDRDIPLSDGWWFWKQAEACVYELPPGGTWERDLRWEVPGAARVSTPEGLVATHDDRLISAALVALYDELVTAGELRTGRAQSTIIRPADPLEHLTF